MDIRVISKIETEKMWTGISTCGRGRAKTRGVLSSVGETG